MKKGGRKLRGEQPNSEQEGPGVPRSAYAGDGKHWPQAARRDGAREGGGAKGGDKEEGESVHGERGRSQGHSGQTA